MRIAIDAMGGDHAPLAIIEGIKQARHEFPNIEFILYGDPITIKKHLADNEMQQITIVPTTEIIEMNDEPVKAIRTKKDSSLVQAALSVKKGENDALLSCGNTGALLAAGLLVVGRLKGVKRPGLISTLPVVSNQDSAFNLIDTGANAENKPEQLHQYAILGKFYAEKVRHLPNPRIGLLNNGTEPHKGNKLTLETYQLLSQEPNINFVGNVEARDLMQGACDVVVADGFTGNAVLKAIEGTALGIMQLLKSSILGGGFRAKLGALLLKPSLMSMKDRLNQAKYGGAVLMGVKAPVVKSHGSSDALTIYYALKQIHEMVESDLIGEFKQYLADHADEVQEEIAKS